MLYSVCLHLAISPINHHLQTRRQGWGPYLFRLHMQAVPMRSMVLRGKLGQFTTRQIPMLVRPMLTNWMFDQTIESKRELQGHWEHSDGLGQGRWIAKQDGGRAVGAGLADQRARCPSVACSVARWGGSDCFLRIWCSCTGMETPV